jgi:hypothetical protein
MTSCKSIYRNKTFSKTPKKIYGKANPFNLINALKYFSGFSKYYHNK